MISKLRVRSFKCFNDSSFNFRSLNVLCGENGVGKSTLLQSLCLALEANRHEGVGFSVDLKNFYGLNLGQVMDVLHKGSGSKEILFCVEGSGFHAESIFGAGTESLESTSLKSLEVIIDGDELPSLTYLSANRCFPGDYFSGDRVSLDFRGQNAPSLLGENDFTKVGLGVAFPGNEKNLNLSAQLGFWLKSIFNDVEVRSVPSSDDGNFLIEVKKIGVLSEWVKPENMGVGIYYVLPILIYGLLAKKGSIFIIDSPEAHLHPSAQSALAIFLSVIAKSGVQLVVETHSDHVLNGIRLGVVNGTGCDSQNVVVHNFNSGADNRYQMIEITPSGNLSAMPEGFFDQSQKDIYAILQSRMKSV